MISIKLIIYFISLPLIGEEPGMEAIPEAYIYLRFPWFSLPSVLVRYFPKKNSKIIPLRFNVTNCQLTDGENYSAVSNFEQ